MLAAFLRLFGIDLHQRIALVKGRVESFTHRAADEVKGQARDVGLMATFYAAGGVMLLMTFVVGLIALHAVVAENYGWYWGLAAVATVTLLLALALFGLASARAKASRESASRFKEAVAALAQPAGVATGTAASATPTPAPRAPPRNFANTETSFAVGDLHSPLRGAVQEFFSAVPRTGTPADKVIGRVSQEAGRISGQTVDAAADLVENGSRLSLVGVLAGSFLLGLFLARQNGGAYSWEGLEANARDSRIAP